MLNRTILLSGACGSGKSTLMSLGHRALSRHLGRTATIDADTILMFVDPKWELSEDEWDLELAGWQCYLLTKSFLSSGFETVILGGNGFHSEADITELIKLLLEVGELYHVTLDPDPSEIQRRVALSGSKMDSEEVAERVEWMRARYPEGTCRVDNTALTPEATLAEIAARVARGEGRITAAPT